MPSPPVWDSHVIVIFSCFSQTSAVQQRTTSNYKWKIPSFLRFCSLARLIISLGTVISLAVCEKQTQTLSVLAVDVVLSGTEVCAMCNTLRSIVSRIFVFPSDRNTHYITNTHTHTRKHSVQRFFSSCANSRKRKNSGRLVCPTNWKSSRKQISWCCCCCFCSAILGLPNLIYQLRVRAGRGGQRTGLLCRVCQNNSILRECWSGLFFSGHFFLSHGGVRFEAFFKSGRVEI